MTVSTANPNPLQQQSLPTGPAPSKQGHPWIIQAAKWAGIVFLVYLIGPFVLIHAIVTQEDAAGPMWHAGQRWARVNGSALPSLLLYVPIILFHDPLAAFWASIFLQLSQWLHLPALAWFGGTTIFPPVPSSTLLRWVLSFSLAGPIALFIEAVKPRTTWETKRIVTQDEQLELAAAAAAAEKRKLKSEQASGTASTGTAPKAVKKSRAKVTLKEEKSPITPEPDSLWGGVDWNAVDDAHPAKQAALQAAAEQRDAQKREAERARFLAQQQSALKQERTRALAKQAKPAQSSKIIDSTLASPVQPPAPTQPVEEYNWDEGEGSIQE